MNFSFQVNYVSTVYVAVVLTVYSFKVSPISHIVFRVCSIRNIYMNNPDVFCTTLQNMTGPIKCVQLTRMLTYADGDLNIYV